MASTCVILPEAATLGPALGGGGVRAHGWTIDWPPMDTSERQDADRGAEDDETTRKRADEVEAYESEWYEVLKRRAEQTQDEEDASEEEAADDGEDGDR